MAELEASERTYGIGDLCRLYDVTARTVRYYESCGILRPERLGQRRVFHAGDLVRLRLALRGRRLGFTLAEAKEMLDLYDHDGGEVAQLERTLEYGRTRIRELEERRREAEEAIRELRAWQQILTQRLAKARGDGNGGKRQGAQMKGGPDDGRA